MTSGFHEDMYLIFWFSFCVLMPCSNGKLFWCREEQTASTSGC